MSIPTPEDRVVALEAELMRLKQNPPSVVTADEAPWWETIRGSFKNDPAYREAMRLGREYRESLRPEGHEDAPC